MTCLVKTTSHNIMIINYSLGMTILNNVIPFSASIRLQFETLLIGTSSILLINKIDVLEHPGRGIWPKFCKISGN